MIRDEVLRNARLAGGVRRYHTWPMLTVQTVADHSFHCMRIYYELWGNLPEKIAVYLLWHDLGELVLGDLPFPVKARNPALKAACDAVEKDAVLAMNAPTDFGLSREDEVRIKVCDLIEMLELGLYEKGLGNSFAQPIIDDIYKSVHEYAQKLRAYDQNLVCCRVSALVSRGVIA